jgi:microcystin degradation protein MlrC
MRAIVAGIAHESSTFATAVTGATTLADFAVHTGTDLVDEFIGSNTCVGGYLAACAEAGVAVLPGLHARAEPAGAVAYPAYIALRERLLATLRTDCELILLDLHGAGVLGAEDSLELDLLRAVRAAVGPSPVLAVTVDLHANLPPELCQLVDVLVGFHEYPHTDMAERARRAAGIAVATARGQVRPRLRLRRLPMVLPPSPTDGGPAARLRDLARDAEREPGVLACTVLHGFPYADTPQAATSVLTVVDGDDTRGDTVNDRLAGWLRTHREEFRPEPLSCTDAVSAGTGGQVIIGDAADNPGGGGSGDGTYLLHAIVDAGVPACFATLFDPAAVARAADAGTGATVELALGGRHGVFSGRPLHVRARVDGVADGRVVQQRVRRGKPVDFGRCVRLGIGPLDLVVASRRVQVFDPQILLRLGIEPERYPVVAVKSAYHFRAGFAALGARSLAADAPGLTSRLIDELTPRGPSAARWPMNPSPVDWMEHTDEPGPSHCHPTQRHQAAVARTR